MTGQGVRTIAVVQATAAGSTELSAFDAALRRAGIADQNLIYLSSIIPPGTKIVRRRPQFDESHFGNRLYCVMAERRTAKPGHQVWAGVGWVQTLTHQQVGRELSRDEGPLLDRPSAMPDR